MGEVVAVLVVFATPVAVADTVALLDEEYVYGIDTVTTAAATAAGVLEVVEVVDTLEVLELTDTLEVLELTDTLEVENDEVEEVAEEGVPAGQSEPASDGGVHPMTCKKTGEHWAPRLES